VILEQLGVANIATQGVNRAVAAHVHHLEDRRATGGGRCQEARAQRVSRELRGIEPQPFGVFLHNVRHALIGQALAHLAVGSLDMPVAVTLDTLNRSIGGPENDEFMTAYVNAADAIRAAFDCAVIIVHHCGVEGTRPRGHSSLTGAVEAQLAVTRDAAGNVVDTVEYMKDGPEGATVVSHLEAVEVGNDEDGEPIRGSNA